MADFGEPSRAAWGQSTLPATAPAAPSAGRPAVVIPLHGPINAYTFKQLKIRFDQARRLGAEVVILEMDTPGGTVDASIAIAEYLRGIKDLRTIAFVKRQAYSGGTIVGVAAHEIHMAPDAVIGLAAPIILGPNGLQPLPDTERAKAAGGILDDLNRSARLRGYPYALLEAMVIVGRTVYWVENDQGERKFVSEKQYDQLRQEGWRPVEGVPAPIDAADTLLTVSTDLAIKLGLARGAAESVEDLARQQNLRILQRIESTAGEKIIDFLNGDVARGVLLMVFFTSLYLAFKTPGMGAPEAAIVVALGVLLGVPAMTGHAQWWEILLVLAGLVFLALEVFVTPGFGVLGFSGLIMIVLGLLLTFAPMPVPGMPQFGPILETTWQGIQRGLVVLVAAMLASLLLALWLRRYLPKMPYFNRLILTTAVGTSPEAVAAGDVMATPWPPVGARGEAATDLKPGGSAQFTDLTGESRIISVVSDSGFVPRGTAVVVRQVSGSHVVVRPVKG